MILGGEIGAPAGLDHDCLMRLDQDSGAVDRMAWLEALAQEHAGFMPCAVRVEPRATRRLGQGLRCHRMHRLGERSGAADGFN